MEFTEAELKQLEQLRTRYPDNRSLTLPCMWMIQKREGFISNEACQLIATELDIPRIWVEEVRSWYSMFTEKEEGKYVLEVCNNISCSLLGSQQIIDYLCDKLNIKVGETTDDGMFTIKTAECLGSCGTGPMMQIGDNYYELLDAEKVDAILEDLRNGKEHAQQPQQFPEYK
ncbi:NADH-quinone oxidoreductase subunit NuoE [candidate division KSB1 bacterium]|nr:NADH-quinone oxidoreductase subunit NuoE [candidate division KSB1 bacterium]